MSVCARCRRPHCVCPMSMSSPLGRTGPQTFDPQRADPRDATIAALRERVQELEEALAVLGSTRSVYFTGTIGGMDVNESAVKELNARIGYARTALDADGKGE